MFRKGLKIRLSLIDIICLISDIIVNKFREWKENNNEKI